MRHRPRQSWYYLVGIIMFSAAVFLGRLSAGPAQTITKTVAGPTVTATATVTRSPAGGAARPVESSPAPRASRPVVSGSTCATTGETGATTAGKRMVCRRTGTLYWEAA